MGKTNTAYCGTGMDAASNSNDLRLVMKVWYSRYNPHIQLSQREMRNISQEISQEYGPKVETNSPELVILPVDPFNLYAYWNLGESKNAANNQKKSGADLVLRVYWRPDDSHDIAETKLWFDVPLTGFHNQRKVRLPIDETDYSAAIGKRFPDRTFDLMAYSNCIHVPRSRMAPVRRSKEKLKSTAAVSKVPVSYMETLARALTTGYYDESLFDSMIKETLYDKGIENDIDVLFSSGERTSEKSADTDKTPSGKGIDR